MRFLTIILGIVISLTVTSVSYSWEVYNRSTAADSELLDGLDSTAFTLQSSFSAYTSTAGGASGNFVSYTTAGTTYANVTTDMNVTGKITGGTLTINDGIFGGVFGGYSNVIPSATEYGFIGGGKKNLASGQYYPSICGGNGNTATGQYYATQCGGTGNDVTANYAASIGGKNNTAVDSYGFIGPANTSNVNGSYGFVGTGISNNAGAYAFVGTGSSNDANASYSAIPSGGNNIADGDFSFLYGRYGATSAVADRSSGFIYGDSVQTITTPDVHVIYGAAGYEKKVGVQVLNPKSTLHSYGSIQRKTDVIITSPYAVDVHNNLIVDASTGSRKLDLIDCTSDIQGRYYKFTGFDVTSTITLDPAVGDQIQYGGADVNYTGISVLGEGEEFTCNGADHWLRTGSW